MHILGTAVRSKKGFIGESVHLPCGDNATSSEQVDWHYQKSQGTKPDRIISKDHVTNGEFEGRLNITGSTLVIRDIKTIDSGNYTCVEHAGHGPSHSIFLTVQGKVDERVFMSDKKYFRL